MLPFNVILKHDKESSKHLFFVCFLQLSPGSRYVDTSNSQNVQKSPAAAALAAAQVENTPLKIKKIMNLIPVLKLKKV